MKAEELVDFLREYLWVMSNIIMDERWFINKYEWDAIMALFWVFGYEDTSTFDNCLSALKQQQNLRFLNKIWQKKFGQVLKVRMWLHSWKAIIWNIWAKWRKMEFTALWDSVNLASRLEWVNKFYWTSICVSEDVVKDVSNDFEFRKLDKIKVKWKDNAIIIYELLWEKNKITDLQRQIRDDFEKALDLYFKNDFSKAKEIFHRLWEKGDITSIVFEKRCFKFELSWVKDDWDWVWTLTEK
jgi:adenylate cyclase